MNATDYVKQVLAERGQVRQVYWVACGGSVIDLYPAHCLLGATSTSIESGIFTAAEFNTFPPAKLGEGSLVVTCSHSGGTPETLAACKYLKNAYARYRDWMTVAASYNAGQGGISGRIEAQGQDSAMDLLLPEETSRYMFRILAAKLFFEHPESFGYLIEPDRCYPYKAPKKTVEVNEPVPSLADFAKKHGTSFFLLRLSNPWLRSESLTNKNRKTYRIDIPSE